MLKQLQIGLRAFLLLASRVWTCICFMIKKQSRAIIQHQSVKYDIFPLSPLSRHRLSIVKRKVLVLDLDETLIHSFHDGVVRQTVRPGTPPDFVLKVVIDHHPVRFFVHKRPHVDFFLDIVSQWYELVVFTASMEIYGAAVADRLDAGRGILTKRFYRQHCTPDMGSYTKDLSSICNDLSSVFILDNSPGAYRAYPDNAIPIKSWFSDPTDVALLNLLPVLDALRFTADVRSVLSRNLHLHRLCQQTTKPSSEGATVVMNERGENGCNGAHAATDIFNNGQCQQLQQRCSGGSVLVPLSRTKRTEQSNDVNCNQNPSLDEITYSGDRPKKI